MTLTNTIIPVEQLPLYKAGDRYLLCNKNPLSDKHPLSNKHPLSDKHPLIW